MKFLFLVISNLKRKKLRTILTILSIFVAFLLFGFLCGIRTAFRMGANLAGADRLIVTHKVSLIQPVPQSYGPRIEGIEGVDAVAGHCWFNGIYQDKKNFFASIAVEPEKFLNIRPEMKISEETRQAWLSTRNGAVVGKVTMEKFKWKVGDTIPMTSPIWGEPANEAAWQFKIVGVYDSDKKGFDNSQFFFRYDFFDEGKQKTKGQMGWYLVRVKDSGQAASIAKRINSEFENSSTEVKADTEAAFAAGWANQIGDVGKIMVGVVSAVFFTMILVAGNTMSQSVRERFEEIGVLKAMGFTNGLALTLVLLESCVIAVIAGVPGLAVSWVLTNYFNPIPDKLPMLGLSERDVMLGAFCVILLGIIAGLVPALQAMRLPIAAALRRNA